MQLPWLHVQSGCGVWLDTCKHAALNLQSTVRSCQGAGQPSDIGVRALHSTVLRKWELQCPSWQGAALHGLQLPTLNSSEHLGQPCSRGKLSPCQGGCPALFIWGCLFSRPCVEAFIPKSWREGAQEQGGEGSQNLRVMSGASEQATQGQGSAKASEGSVRIGRALC